ncbi:MAG: DUF4440 domain-containing protein [Acidobacteria bacterium]|nr:DUF4440 domain-containing protein [Acidobacteriota bacterium]
MKKALGLCLLLLAAASGGAADAPRNASPELAAAVAGAHAIEAVWVEFFAAMQARDGEALLAVMSPETPILRVGDDGTVRSSTGEAFAAALADMSFEPRETIVGAVSIEADVALATVRMPYEFHRGDVYSHCGVNFFHLVRGAEGWRMVAIVYSVHEVCAADGKSAQ